MENNNYEDLIGEFILTLFKSDNYMVSKFKTDDGPITITGPSFDYERNCKYKITGNYVDHPKYGFQFNMVTIEKYLSDEKDDIINFLSSNTFKNIGKKTALKIYDYFGKDVLNILKNDCQLIYDVKLTDKQYLSIIEGFTKLNDPENETLFYLISNGFNNIEAQKIFNRFKLSTIEISKDNPFRFYNDVNGMSFTKVKEFASKIEFSESELKFKESFIIYLLTEICFNTGDIYINKEDFINTLKRYGIVNEIEEIINKAIYDNYIVIEDDRLYLNQDYNDEKFIAYRLKRFSDGLNLDNTLIEEGISNNENDFGITYNEDQKQAIRNFFQNNVSIITGGPGTGKTTIVKTMVNIFKTYFPYNNLIVVAPTGRAAKRINEICECEAKTIHSLLKWNLETNTFIFDLDNPIIYDTIIIDEFSMVDNNLFACLLKACARVKKICIIGDENQLPSIRPGYVLNDLLKSNMFVSCKLTSNYRQSSGNDIIELAKDIIDDCVEFNKYSKDINLIDLKKQSFDIVSAIKEDLNNGYTLDDIQVLAPMYKGEFGIDNLNNTLQFAFNPKSISKNEKVYGKYTFRENDKVLQLKNRPVDDVFNGDIGIIEDIDEKEKSILVNYQGIYVFYKYEELIDLSLAYAMSVHKSQGSEYKIVYFILSRSNMHMLNKKLIYTAISRAKIKLNIICNEAVFIEGLHHLMSSRKTTLIDRLTNE